MIQRKLSSSIVSTRTTPAPIIATTHYFLNVREKPRQNLLTHIPAGLFREAKRKKKVSFPSFRLPLEIPTKRDDDVEKIHYRALLTGVFTSASAGAGAAATGATDSVVFESDILLFRLNPFADAFTIGESRVFRIRALHQGQNNIKRIANALFVGYHQNLAHTPSSSYSLFSVARQSNEKANSTPKADQTLLTSAGLDAGSHSRSYDFKETLLVSCLFV